MCNHLCIVLGKINVYIFEIELSRINDSGIFEVIID